MLNGAFLKTFLKKASVPVEMLDGGRWKHLWCLHPCIDWNSLEHSLRRHKFLAKDFLSSKQSTSKRTKCLQTKPPPNKPTQKKFAGQGSRKLFMQRARNSLENKKFYGMVWGNFWGRGRVYHQKCEIRLYEWRMRVLALLWVTV